MNNTSKIYYYSNRLEIALLTTAVRVMMDRDARRNLLRRIAYGSALFCLALLLAFLFLSPLRRAIAIVIGPVSEGQTGTFRAAAASGVANGQRNLLLILTSQSHSDSPLLQGAWVVLRSPSKSELTWIPLYPLPQSELAAVFELQPDGLPSPNFTQSIQPADLWWDYYLVFDEVALVELVEWMYVDNPVQNPLAGQQYMPGVSAAQLSPQEALEQQTLLLQAMCSGAPPFLQRADPGATLERLAESFRTDLDTASLINRWRSLQALGSALSCKFPVLSEPQLPTALH